MRMLFISSTRIGDAVLSTGALGWALNQWPAARVTIACGPDAAPLFEAVPRLERIIVMRKEPLGGHWRKLWLAGIGKWWGAIIDLRRSAMPYMLPAARRYILSHSDTGRHMVERVADMIGEDARHVSPTIWTAQKHETQADELIGAARPVLALAPTANWGGKEWPVGRFVDLAARLTAPGGAMEKARIAVFSAPSEAERAAALVNDLPSDRVIDLCGKTDLLTAYACLKRADLFIGNDSALMHLAAASGTPTLGLFGPSLDRVYGPWGERTAVARTDLSFDEIINLPGYDHKSHVTRMETLPVDRVYDRAVALLQKSRAPV